ncbi:MAG: hypothetical protein AAB682_00795 [Patescibacteria group bacterium]
METLGKLFCSTARVKILRLFLSNPERIYSPEDVARRSKVMPREARKELKLLESIDFIKAKSGSMIIGGVDGTAEEKVQIRGFQTNTLFPFFSALKALLVNTAPFRKEEIISRFRGVGRVKLIVIAGVFTQDEDSRADILVVADDIKKRALDIAVKGIEAEIGRELHYGVFESKDFLYRIGVYDKFVRDILDYPHEKIVDKIGI